MNDTAGSIGLRRKTAKPFLAILGDWMIVASVVALAVSQGGILFPLLAILVVGARQHALFVMIHEAAHSHIARNKALNDWTSDLFCAFPLLFDTDIYRQNHLQHHRHLNSAQDPDWVRKVGKADWTFPTSLSALALFLPRFVLVQGPKEWGYILWRFSGFGDKKRWQAQPRFFSI